MNDKDTSYRNLVKDWIRKARERDDAAREETGVRLADLRSRMPWGCWIWLMILGFGLFTLGGWILTRLSPILP